MPRSTMWVRDAAAARVQDVFNKKFGSQQALVEFLCEDWVAGEYGVTVQSTSTISNFLNGKALDRPKFQAICKALELDWREVYAVSEVFISHCSSQPDHSIAQAIAQTVKNNTKCEIFPFKERPIRRSNRVESLKRCDYFLLLLSNASAESETITEEVKQAIEFRNKRPSSVQYPRILAVLIDTPISLSYDLNSYLQEVSQLKWHSSSDLSTLTQAILSFVTEGQVPSSLQVELENSSSTSVTLPVVPPIATEAQERPLPIAPPELPEGQVELASRFYVDRPPVETDCYEQIARPGALIRIKAPRQTGKTSLMARILRKAEQQGDRVATLSFQLASPEVFASLESLLQWICTRVSIELDLPIKWPDYWKPIFDSPTNFERYFVEYLLPTISGSITIGLDEVDRLFEYPECYPFFSLLRYFHEQSKTREIWRQLRLVIVYSTEVYISLADKQSPFQNVGLGIQLPEFTPQQVQNLAERHQLFWSEEQVQQLMSLVGGHPFLIRLALYHMARQNLALSQVLQTATTPNGVFSDHLRYYELKLSRYPELATAMQAVVNTGHPIRLEQTIKFKLEGLGLVKLLTDGVVPRCDLYRRYFQTYQLETEE